MMWVRLGEVGLGLLEVRGVLRAKKKVGFFIEPTGAAVVDLSTENSSIKLRERERERERERPVSG